MRIDGAVITEQGVTFAVVIVKPFAIQTNHAAADARAAFQGYFPGLPIVLAAQDSHGLFEYQGRRDLVDFLALIDADRIPWMEYTFS